MSKHRRDWSIDEKEKIVLFSVERGIMEASREFGVSTVSIYKWKEKFQELGKDGLAPGAMSDLERELKQVVKLINNYCF